MSFKQIWAQAHMLYFVYSLPGFANALMECPLLPMHQQTVLVRGLNLEPFLPPLSGPVAVSSSPFDRFLVPSNSKPKLFLIWKLLEYVLCFPVDLFKREAATYSCHAPSLAPFPAVGSRKWSEIRQPVRSSGFDYGIREEPRRFRGCCPKSS